MSDTSLVIPPPDTSHTDPPNLPNGVHQVTCAEVKDLGERPNFDGTGTQRQVLLVFHAMIQGELHQALRFYNCSLNEKSHLRRDLGAWRGAPYTDEELRAAGGFDVMSLAGQACTVTVMEKLKSNGDSYADVKSLAPPQP